MPSTVDPIGRKVVHLEADSERIVRARLAQLPKAIQDVHETCQRALLGRLKAYFERADDALFDLADKALSNEEQNIYFDSMREVRVRRHSIETNFSIAIDEAFGALVDTQSPRPVDEAYEGLKADALSLVHDDDLEALVAVDSSVARANSDFGEAIQYISLRLDSLVPVKVYQKNNPVGADVVCAAFMTEIKKLDVSIKAKLLLFRLFDKMVIGSLGDIYRQINNVLIEHNVMPSLPSRGTKRHPMRRQTDAADGRGQAQAAPRSILTPEVTNTLTRLFGEQLITEGAVQVNAEQLAANQLVQLLNAAQRLPQQAGVLQKGADIRALVAQLKARKTGAKIGRVEDQVMNLVNMLFDFILEDRNLAPAMKTLISRMQIPIIKVALADKTFFTKRGHVARKLLNEMSTAAIGWQGDAQNADKDPLYKKIDHVVRTLLNDFNTDVSIFNDLLVDFTAFLEKERKRIAILERRTVDAEDGKAKAEVARTTVALEIEVRIQEYVLPEAVSKLINDAWSNVLFVTALKHGYDSKEWLGMLDTLDELLWSVQQPANAEQRQKLIKSVPQLLKKIRTGLDTISYNPFEMSSLFKSLEEVHLGCIRGKSPVVMRAEKEELAQPSVEEQHNPQAQDAEPAVAPARESDAQPESEPSQLQNEPEIEEIAIEGLNPFSSAAGQATPEVENDEPEAYHLQQVDSFVQGAWFDLKLQPESNSRCRLAAFIKPTGKYIFVNRNGMKVAEKSKEELALMLKRNALRPLDNSMLFDRALETIVSGIRKTRPV